MKPIKRTDKAGSKQWKLSDLTPNPKNPRLIKDPRFKKLVKSISEFPKMMELRPIIIDDNRVILGGNMRYLALKKLKYKEVPADWVKQVSDLTEEERERFILIDNESFGEWDYEMLASSFDEQKFTEWGLSVFVPTTIDPDEFFAGDATNKDEEGMITMTLKFHEDQYEYVVKKLRKHGKTPELAIIKLLE